MTDPLPEAAGAPALLRPLAGLLGACGLVSYLGWLAGAQIGGLVAGWDFRAYYAAARVVWQGANLYELGSPTTPFYLYPPTLAALLAPLGVLSLHGATLVWFVLQHAALIGAGGLLVGGVARAAGWRGAGPGGILAGLLLFLWGTGVPLREEVYLGQVNSLVLLLIGGGLLLAAPEAGAAWGGEAMVQGRSPVLQWRWPALAGLCLALAISIKVFPALLLPLLLFRGRRQVVAWAVGGFGVLQGGVGLLTVGARGYSSTLDYWFSLFPDLPRRPGAYLDNQGANGLLARLLLPAPDPALPTLGDHPRLWALATTGTTMLVLGVAGALIFGPALIARRRAVPPAAAAYPSLVFLLEASLLLISINLVSSIAWPHHMLWWGLPALTLTALALRGGPRPAWTLLAVGAVAAILSISPGDWLQVAAHPGIPLVTVLGSGMHFYAMALLWLASAAALPVARLPPPSDRGLAAQ